MVRLFTALGVLGRFFHLKTLCIVFELCLLETVLSHCGHVSGFLLRYYRAVYSVL